MAVPPLPLDQEMVLMEDLWDEDAAADRQHHHTHQLMHTDDGDDEDVDHMSIQGIHDGCMMLYSDEEDLLAAHQNLTTLVEELVYPV